ncbi:hypothetical protein EDB83DRAFT_2445974 [Lactarius deliciosus]|nr:hypothetical protein EDB83DRAFT_2445974 [Lactarius deliciosus]
MRKYPFSGPKESAVVSPLLREAAHRTRCTPPRAENLAGLNQKKKEAEVVDVLHRTSALFLQRFEGLGDDCEIMADAGADAWPFPRCHCTGSVRWRRLERRLTPMHRSSPRGNALSVFQSMSSSIPVPMYHILTNMLLDKNTIGNCR